MLFHALKWAAISRYLKEYKRDVYIFMSLLLFASIFNLFMSDVYNFFYSETFFYVKWVVNIIVFVLLLRYLFYMLSGIGGIFSVDFKSVGKNISDKKWVLDKKTINSREDSIVDKYLNR